MSPRKTPDRPLRSVPEVGPIGGGDSIPPEFREPEPLPVSETGYRHFSPSIDRAHPAIPANAGRAGSTVCTSCGEPVVRVIQ